MIKSLLILITSPSQLSAKITSNNPQISNSNHLSSNTSKVSNSTLKTKIYFSSCCFGKKNHEETEATQYPLLDLLNPYITLKGSPLATLKPQILHIQEKRM